MVCVHNSYLRKIQKKYFILTYPLSIVYGFFLDIRNFLYDKKIISTYTLEGCCISIGNIHLGGSGKSPFLLEFIKLLLCDKHRPVILTRGYMSGMRKSDIVIYKAGEIIYSNSKNPESFIPDEALMYSYLLPEVPVVVGCKRYLAAQVLLKNISYKPSHWLLDDGFQHRSLDRNINVVLMDESSRLSEDYLLPSGVLREAKKSLIRATHIVLTYGRRGAKNFKLIESIRVISKVNVIRISYYTQWPINITNGSKLETINKKTAVVCGIAEPRRFLSMLKNIGIHIDYELIVGDHQKILFSALDDLSKKVDSIIMTEKDYFRNRCIFSSLKTKIFIAKLRVEGVHMKNIYNKIMYR